ncbi:serine/threonine protein kinase [Ochrobactrum sp. MR34]|nr:serine/threonine protein kinase [Ochrobactrum sp. MR34]
MTELISNLEIGCFIGNGFFGEVFEGADQIHGKVAVKILKQKSTETEDQWEARRDNMIKEGEHLKKASHRNVVAVHSLLHRSSGNEIHLVMEHCSGGSLQTMYDNGPISPLRVHSLATDIVTGLKSLHSRGMLHRDIKPGNILLNEQGSAKLGDFGLVTDNLILGYGSQAGYSDHIAPEVWHGSGTNVKTDLWALGMTFYRLLHGKHWYEMSPAPRLVVRDGKFVDGLKWLPHVSAKWKRVIRRLLNDTPSLRYQDCSQLLNDLSSLALEADWQCIITSETIIWHRFLKTRKIQVEWKKHSERKYSWDAKSHPVGVGRIKNLGGKGLLMSKSQSEKELISFFAGQT